jgi:hypothetical protein
VDRADRHAGPIVITHLVITVPIVVWIMIGFFEGLPASSRRRRWSTAPRSGRPSAMSRCRWRGRASSVAMILAFIFSWNNFIFGVVLAGRETRTLPVAVYNMLTFEQISWGPLAPRRCWSPLPVLLLTLLASRRRSSPASPPAASRAAETIGSVQIGTAVMLREGRDDTPRGGHRVRLRPALAPVRARR